MENVNSYIIEKSELEDLLFAVEMILSERDKRFVSEDRQERLKKIYYFLLRQSDRNRHIEGKSLTPREMEIYKLLLDGLSHEEISITTNITIHTVKIHAKNIYRKLSVVNKVDLILKYAKSY